MKSSFPYAALIACGSGHGLVFALKEPPDSKTWERELAYASLCELRLTMPRNPDIYIWEGDILPKDKPLSPLRHSRYTGRWRSAKPREITRILRSPGGITKDGWYVRTSTRDLFNDSE